MESEGSLPCSQNRVPHHHGVAHPQVADGGEGRQIWRVTENISNKQSRRADKGWGLGVGLTTLPCKKENC